ncbi:MAG: tyrosine recombinase XerD [Acidimicrobiia bacterium]|nr:tyrosine recombinase XerD [Acidimicrobiia bacterium]
MWPPISRRPSTPERGSRNATSRWSRWPSTPYPSWWPAVSCATPRPSSACWWPSSAAPPAEEPVGDDQPETALLPLEVEDFLTWLVTERGRAANTVEAYRRDLRGYCAWLTDEGLTPQSAAPEDLDRWVTAQAGGELSAATVARRTVAVRTFHRFLVAEGLRADDPTVDLGARRVPAGLPKALTEPQILALLEATEGDDPLSRRDRALIELLYGTGARISEAVALSLADLDLEAATVRVTGKGSKERVLPLGRMVRVALREWLDPDVRGAMLVAGGARHDATAVFVNRRGRRLTRQGAWDIVVRRGRAAGIVDGLSPHVLRHSCATHMIDHGADIRAVQELLGHVSISTTQVYTKVAPERLRRVFDAAHPRARQG